MTFYTDYLLQQWSWSATVTINGKNSIIINISMLKNIRKYFDWLASLWQEEKANISNNSVFSILLHEAFCNTEYNSFFIVQFLLQALRRFHQYKMSARSGAAPLLWHKTLIASLIRRAVLKQRQSVSLLCLCVWYESQWKVRMA